MMLLDILLLLAVTAGCWYSYQRKLSWLQQVNFLLLRLFAGYGFLRQLLTFSPLLVGYLLSCHWLNTHGWHATAAGGMVLAMTIGLNAMRSFEEQQKLEITSCEG
ncbi:MAG: hypothetical protein CO186_09445 [Zetaproteobacteria bacterium CG_4_9_14_3_um_filter_49_83]|nr:MAG: hypothetical protein AUJ56_12915 [Zetaproteobacteria bacterium CG1_02_49_23]PIQ30903.1 MAG: hypothetical protein COW62_11030 [Zetaproteobacteria bacterium CG17_big_fil_post_rev_8_21_14_2_50_50_13]PIV30830.1 MAG: hypothetical protein COS35_04460 [Zetaproteobacteria bacterium CG02_land_8_20_14_3_00_50_9]PIY56222.1 MAG: hypothetical protein COZ00_05295 [Zetaproteobacteria bacterium CG_4_10_14_0_8_um_filter_49_80]PJA34705.1 MAG: hypothetical protein CO186_09445 [Zetaproteobacteria bacterium